MRHFFHRELTREFSDDKPVVLPLYTIGLEASLRGVSPPKAKVMPFTGVDLTAEAGQLSTHIWQ
jgi:hypothetical protein